MEVPGKIGAQFLTQFCRQGAWVGKALDQFTCYMLAVGSTAPISAEQELAASCKCLNEKFSRLADGIPANFQVRDALAEVIDIVH